METITLHDLEFTESISKTEVQQAINGVAVRLNDDYKKKRPVFLTVLNGAFLFSAELVKKFNHECELSFIKVASYDGLTQNDEVFTVMGAEPSLKGRDVNDFVVGFGLDYKGLGRNLTSIYKLKNTTMKNLVLFGPPGAGKGTQAEVLKDKYDLVHISTGDVFRYNIKNATELGTLAKSYIDKGQLVPDTVTIDMLNAEVEKNPEAKGFIFDGFPRTEAQADALAVLLESKGTEVAGMVALEVDDEVLVQRLLERGKTSGRADDADEEVIRHRIQVYYAETAILKGYYEKQDKYHGVDGVGSITEITDRLSDVIDTL